MNGLLVVSPHLDDAVFSCGQLIAGWPGQVTVATACTAIPDVALTAYDQACGFESSEQAAVQRLTEDERAASIVNVRTDWLGILDGQYRALDHTEVLDALLRLFRALEERRGTTTIVVPLGLHHLDHLVVSDAALVALGSRARTTGPVWVYEELPYRVEDPIEAIERMARLDTQGWSLGPIDDPPPVGPLYVKEAARACYRSQRPEWEHALFVPERLHAATWIAPIPEEEAP